MELTVEIIQDTLGPLKPLLADPEMTDILVFSAQKIYVRRRHSEFVRFAGGWRSDEDLAICLEAISRFIKRKLDRDNPILDARLPDGSRVNVIMAPCYASGGAFMALRIFGQEPLGVDELLGLGAFDPAGLAVLKSIMAAGRNILISGGVGSGKTTLLNALCGFIPAGELVVTVEDAREIQIGHALWAALESKKKIYADDTEYTLRDLVRNALRMNPRWLIVGEVRGPEAHDLCRAMNTGQAAIGTIHANSAYDALLALETLYLQSGLESSARAVRETIARAVHVVIQAEMLPDHSRKIVEIAEVRGLDRTSPDCPYVTAGLYRFLPEGMENHRIRGRFEVAGPPRFVERLRKFNPGAIPEFWSSAP